MIRYTWTGTATPGTYLQFDAYDVVYRDASEPIVAGRIKETLTWQAKKSVIAGASAAFTYDNNSAYSAFP